jgi:hypothetical protein
MAIDDSGLIDSPQLRSSPKRSNTGGINEDIAGHYCPAFDFSLAVVVATCEAKVDLAISDALLIQYANTT